MIIVRLNGGLGNQLFQYALGRHLALLNNTELKLDIFGYSINAKRYYLLNNFNIQAKLASREEISDLTSRLFAFGYTRNNIGSKFLRRFTTHQKFMKNTQHIFEKRLFFFQKEILKLQGDFYLDGYWQNPNYFTAIRNTLIQELQLKESSVGDEIIESITNNQSVSIHVRRGDYISNKHNRRIYYELPIDYYKLAIAYLKTKIESPIFYIFSDDVTWCQQNISSDVNLDFIYPKSRSCYDDFHLMSKCKHHIIANSTFSWWAAWLNTNLEKIVISPEKWFNFFTPDGFNLNLNSWIKF